jgi:hypothetical protein
MNFLSLFTLLTKASVVSTGIYTFSEKLAGIGEVAVSRPP